MRYQNWDVLLFPEGSKIPIQEFKTQCFVTRDLESPVLRSGSVPGFSFVSDGKTTAQLPVLTTFVASLVHNAAFRVSVHSWEKPRPSRFTESLLQPDDCVMFEARVYVDGLCVSASIFSQRTQWPHVIDSSSHVDKNGNQDALHFPPFHQEILTQNHWDAAESLGRIKVVIAEGCSRPHRSPPFERIRDVLVFSFQHAPLHILEFSGIAWPNPGMWAQMQARSINHVQAVNPRPVPKDDEDAHAHSPTRRSDSSASLHVGGAFAIPYLPWGYGPPIPSPGVGWHQSAAHDTIGSLTVPIHDPFVDSFRANAPSQTRRSGRSTREDVPMPDYVSQGSSSLKSRAVSNMTGVSYEPTDDCRRSADDENAMNELVEALSPFRKSDGGTLAPANTPSSVPPTAPGTSAAAEARSASYPHSTNRVVSLEVYPHSESRKMSDTCPKSHGADVLVHRKTHASPSNAIKSKKEGKEGQEALDQKENESDSVETSAASGDEHLNGKISKVVNIAQNEATSVSNEAKRKRSLTTVTDPQPKLKSSIATPSPSKKTSKVFGGKAASMSLTGDDSGEGGVSVRTPLQEIGGVD